MSGNSFFVDTSNDVAVIRSRPSEEVCSQNEEDAGFNGEEALEQQAKSERRLWQKVSMQRKLSKRWNKNKKSYPIPRTISVERKARRSPQNSFATADTALAKNTKKETKESIPIEELKRISDELKAKMNVREAKGEKEVKERGKTLPPKIESEDFSDEELIIAEVRSESADASPEQAETEEKREEPAPEEKISEEQLKEIREELIAQLLLRPKRKRSSRALHEQRRSLSPKQKILMEDLSSITESDGRFLSRNDVDRVRDELAEELVRHLQAQENENAKDENKDLVPLQRRRSFGGIKKRGRSFSSMRNVAETDLKRVISDLKQRSSSAKKDRDSRKNKKFFHFMQKKKHGPFIDEELVQAIKKDIEAEEEKNGMEIVIETNSIGTGEISYMSEMEPCVHARLSFIDMMDDLCCGLMGRKDSSTGMNGDIQEDGVRKRVSGTSRFEV